MMAQCSINSGVRARSGHVTWILASDWLASDHVIWILPSDWLRSEGES